MLASGLDLYAADAEHELDLSWAKPSIVLQAAIHASVEAAETILRFEEHGLVAELGKLMRAGEPCRPRADNGNALARGGAAAERLLA